MEHTADIPPLSWPHYLLVFFVSLLLWVLLTGTFDRQELVAGVLVSAAVTLLFGRRFEIFTGFRFSWLAPFHILSYLGYFFVALIRANLDLAARVLAPSLPINPALVEIRTGLKSPLGRMLLANSITLTPGTLTVDVVDDRLLVHWVYCPPGTDLHQATERISAAFERHLSRFLI
ncbi:MAG TPA: cation:proton antiporter [Gammaproteobacteria bacterium]|nr:cation:proton antiporter [Gammaproteobacteria bacterium]